MKWYPRVPGSRICFYWNSLSPSKVGNKPFLYTTTLALVFFLGRASVLVTPSKMISSIRHVRSSFDTRGLFRLEDNQTTDNWNWSAGGQDNMVAYCVVGAFNTLLTNGQMQYNLREYVIKPLQADLFVHSDTNIIPESLRKEIFDIDVYASEIETFHQRLKPVYVGLQRYTEAVRAGSEFKCTNRNKWHVANFRAVDPVMWHAEKAYDAVRIFEGFRKSKYKYIMVARSEIFYYPSPRIKDMMVTQVGVAEEVPFIFGTSVMSYRADLNHRIAFMSRSYADQFFSLRNFTRSLSCDEKFDLSVCTNKKWNECLFAWYHHRAQNVSVRSLDKIVHYSQYRRCGTKHSCANTIELICETDDFELCKASKTYFARQLGNNLGNDTVRLP